MESRPSSMRIAAPLREGVFCEHFGRCDAFFICDACEGKVRSPRVLSRPKTRCESIPDWLRSLGVDRVVAGGIGQVAVRRLSDLGIEVSPGHAGSDPRKVVSAHLAKGGGRPNPCAGFEHRHHHCRE